MAIYLPSNFFSIEIIILFNVTIFALFILATYLIFKKERKKDYIDNKNRQKTKRNEVVDVLIDSYRQPTIFLSRKNIVLSYNQAFVELIQQDDIAKYVEESDYIQKFLRGGHIHRRFEEQINDKDYYIDLDRIDSDIIKGTIITYSDISSLKDIYKRQEYYINDIKHELKTPITAIIGLTDLLIEEKIKDVADQKKALKTINSETYRLNGLINTLTSNIAVTTNNHFFDLDDLFDELRLIYSSKESPISVTFANYVDEEIKGDKEILKQIIINLVDNSLKYTEEGYVKVSSIIEDNTVQIAIVDTGIGMEEVELNKIFDRFYRIDKSRNRETGGFGLGLSIVKTLVDKIDAKIRVESKINNGTTFTIILKKQI